MASRLRQGYGGQAGAFASPNGSAEFQRGILSAQKTFGGLPDLAPKMAKAPNLSVRGLHGSGARTRTADKVVNSHLLYQLSYTGKFCRYKPLFPSGRAGFPQQSAILMDGPAVVNKFFIAFFRDFLGPEPV